MVAVSFDRQAGAQHGSATINVSASGPTLIVAGVAGKRIWVLSYVIVSTAANSITLEDSDGTVWVGPLPCAANGGVAPPFNKAGHFHLPTGKSLMIGNTSAAQTGGQVSYVTV